MKPRNIIPLASRYIWACPLLGGTDETEQGLLKSWQPSRIHLLRTEKQIQTNFSFFGGILFPLSAAVVISLEQIQLTREKSIEQELTETF